MKATMKNYLRTTSQLLGKKPNKNTNALVNFAFSLNFQ